MSTATAQPANTRRAAVVRATRRVGAKPTQRETQGTEHLRRINSRAQLRQLMERADHDGSRAYLITPELAGWLLELNTENRKMSRGRVDRYKHLIAAGLYMNTGEPIIVSDTGILNEGQHRLLAIKEQGVPVPTDIRFGISRKAFTATGTGATRTAANVLEIQGGLSYHLTLASSARLILQYQLGLPQSVHMPIASQEILAAVERWKDDMLTAVKMVMKLRDTYQTRFGNAAACAFTFLALRQKNEATVHEFMEIVASGAHSNMNNPARRLFDRFRREQQDYGSRRTRDNNVERLALFIKAWNAWIGNHQMEARVLRWRSEGPQAEGFPEMQSVRF